MKKPLWTCPQCGHRFVTRNMSHSCTRVPLAAHFAGKDPKVRRLFDYWRAFVRRCGPMAVYAQKTRIVFQTRVRFAGAVIRKSHVECRFWLKRHIKSPRFSRVEDLAPLGYVYYFRLTDPAQLDEDMAEFVREAYAVGQQESQE